MPCRFSLLPPIPIDERNGFLLFGGIQKNVVVSQSTYVCSLHFEAGAFYSKKRRRESSSGEVNRSYLAMSSGLLPLLAAPRQASQHFSTLTLKLFQSRSSGSETPGISSSVRTSLQLPGFFPKQHPSMPANTDKLTKTSFLPFTLSHFVCVRVVLYL